MHELIVEQEIAKPLKRVFAFFESPENLEAITPAFLNFEITSPRPIEMQSGARIEYRLRVRGVPIRWRTAITAYEPPHRFVDEQLRGPYRLWVHEHVFCSLGNGSTLIRDHVRYELPRVPGRGLVHRLWVRPDLEKIFSYRKQAIARLLAGTEPQAG